MAALPGGETGSAAVWRESSWPERPGLARRTLCASRTWAAGQEVMCCSAALAVGERAPALTEGAGCPALLALREAARAQMRFTSVGSLMAFPF